MLVITKGGDHKPASCINAVGLSYLLFEISIYSVDALVSGPGLQEPVEESSGADYSKTPSSLSLYSPMAIWQGMQRISAI